MTLQSSGAISINNIATEFGGSTPHSLNEYYRGGSLVPNTSTNSSIPTSGTIRLSNFYGASADVFFISTLGGTGTENGRGVAIDSSGNIYVCGSTNSQGAGQYDILIAKYNKKGVIQWQRSIGGNSSEYGNGIAVDSSGNAYVVGSNLSQTNGIVDIFLAKYNTSGTLQWQRSIGSINGDDGTGIVSDASGNIYIIGWITNQQRDVFVAKYNTSGTIQWQRRFSSTINDEGMGIAIDNSSNIYICADMESDNRIGIVKYNSGGTLQWQRVFGNQPINAHGISVDSSGNSYICGGRSGGVLVKYNTSGTIQWQRLLGSSSDSFFSISSDSSGNTYSCGRVLSQGAGAQDILIAKYNTSGTIQWQRSLGASSTDIGYGIVTDSSGSIYLCGETNSIGAGGGDLLLAKLPDNGSNTGTFRTLVYASRTLTSATTTQSANSSAYGNATTSFANQTRTLTSATRTLTSTTTIIN